MSKLTKTLLLSMLTLCISTALVVGGTFALFTDTASVNNHLQAGNLDIGLFRTSYTEKVLGSNGLMTESEVDTTAVNLATNGSTLFNMVNAVPTSTYTATIEVSNLGSVAFDYGVRIIWSANRDTTDNDDILAEQIKITIKSEKIENSTNSVSFYLADCDDNDVSLGYLLKNAGAEAFTVKAEFINDDNVNNSAMLANLSFDVQLYAVQKV